MNSLQLSTADMTGQIESFQQSNVICKKILQDSVDYMVIPNTTKTALLKSGAEKLARFFKIHVDYDITTEDLGNNHREFVVDAIVKTNSDEMKIGEGTGSCNTRESKYLYRKKGRVCPVCGKEAIIKGKKEYGGGWLCFNKNGGCGAKFSDGSEEIESQIEGYVEYENPADYYNTCRKMAKKRAYVDAIITCLGIDMTQDLDEVLENMFAYSEAKTRSDTEDFAEIKAALETANIPRKNFSDWLKMAYGKDVDTVSVLKKDKIRILEKIQTSPSEFMI